MGCTEAILLTILVFLGFNVAWLLLFTTGPRLMGARQPRHQAVRFGQPHAGGSGRSFREENRMRLVVVGAGIVGSACAYAASSLGAEVILIDAGWPGQATAAGAGIICPWTSGVDDPGGYDFACAAAQAYPALVAELADLGEADVSYRQSGAIVVADREDELEPVRAALEARRRNIPRWGTARSSPAPRFSACSRRCARTCPRCTSRAPRG